MERGSWMKKRRRVDRHRDVGTRIQSKRSNVAMHDEVEVIRFESCRPARGTSTTSKKHLQRMMGPEGTGRGVVKRQGSSE